MNIPAIRGKIGNTVYYSANFSFQQINELVDRKVGNEIYTSKTLKDRLQRSLTDNSGKIKQYILEQDDRFFNALVLAVYDGEPQWTEIRFELDEDEFPNVGILHFNGKEKIFPVDGQHRVEGIKEAVKKNPALVTETISVILIGHSTSDVGMKKSRRIFSTLNRYAKPVKLGDIIALDEDDIVAIATRELLETHILFTGDRIKATNTKSIPVNDKSSFTSLITLYECNVELFQIFYYKKIISKTKLKDFLRSRPDEDTIYGYIKYLNEFWNLMIDVFPEIEDFINGNPLTAAEKYRDPVNGGNIIFRPVALLQMIKAISYICSENNEVSIKDVLDIYSRLDRSISNEPWTKIIWDPTSKRMLVNNQLLLKYLFIYIFNSELLKDKDKKELYNRYALVNNIARDSVEDMLNKYIVR